MKRRGKRVSVQNAVKVNINEAIRHPEVRLIGNDSSQLGIFSTADALKKAYDEGLDLVEVSGNAKPPVCRIMNYDKFRYEQAKKLQEAKKKQTTVETKEIKFRPKTEAHDLDFKLKHVRKFLAQKNKVKLTMRFRGREIVYCQTVGLEAMNKIAAALEDDAAILQPPRMEGRQMVMFVGPKT
ncbi:MAG TPA: translation initiation factor IF-3 [Desulfocapsa sulfexigens]|nr:translation initiation factor IF-3 [Desulfocapsa sulfexigens]HIQ38044.1 translation initiation factor IF-3 [Desulfocapsa sulfexigens]